MAIKKFMVKYLLVFSIIFLVAKKNTDAQPVKHNDVKKLELIIHSNSLIAGRRILEVIPENGTWNCYQTSLKKFDIKQNIDDSSRRFLYPIPKLLLSQLLEMINKPDTTINLKVFGVDKNDLVKYLDSLQTKLSAAEKTRLTELIESKEGISHALYGIYHPVFKMLDDRDAFVIKITTIENSVIEAYATSFGYLDFEPWHIGKLVSYNSNFALIFETIAGEDRYVKGAKKRIALAIDKQLYYDFFAMKVE